MPDPDEPRTPDSELPEAPPIPEDIRAVLGETDPEAQQSMRRVAVLAGVYAETLLAQGFTREEILVLVVRWQTTFFENMYRYNLGGDDPE